MKLELRERRAVAVSPMKTMHWSTSRDAGLRGGLGILISKSLVASWSAGMQSHQGKTKTYLTEPEFLGHLKVKEAWNFGNVQHVAYNLTFKNVPVTMSKSLVTSKSWLACVDECKCILWVSRKISGWIWKFCHLPFIKDNFTMAKRAQVINIFSLFKQKFPISTQVEFLKIVHTIKGELRLWWKSKEHQQIWALLSFWIAFLLLSSFKWFSMAGTFFLISHS